METPAPQPNEQPETIFEDVLDTSAYDKKVRSARTAIFVVAGIQLAFGIYVAFTGNEELRNIQIGIAVVISAMFFGLGLWSKSKPFTAIITALSLYVGLLVLDAIYEPSSLVKGVILKILIIGYLAKGIGAAKSAQDIKNIAK
jgi:hypothetical protein